MCWKDRLYGPIGFTEKDRFRMVRLPTRFIQNGLQVRPELAPRLLLVGRQLGQLRRLAQIGQGGVPPPG
jgi:hypothetical protein